VVDAVALATLEAEVGEDLRIIAAAAASLARARYGSASDPELEATAYQLARLYSALEQLAIRVARAFENHIDDRSGWHVELVRRLSLTIPGVRPAFFAPDLHDPLVELRGFRHVVRHAYDVKLDPTRVANVIAHAERCAALLPECARAFFTTVRSSAP
jgi:hypothetical protein